MYTTDPEFGPDAPECANNDVETEQCRRQEDKSMWVFVYSWLAVCMAHVFPFIAVTVDMYHNSIAFYWRQFAFMWMITISYDVFNVYRSMSEDRGPDRDPIYPFTDYYKKEGLAVFGSMALTLGQIAIFGILVCIANKKLQNRFEKCAHSPAQTNEDTE